MKKVKKGEVGLLINPSHVNTLITEEDIDREIEKVLTGQLTYQKRMHEKDLIVKDEDYLEYLEMCKQSLVKPSHPVSDEEHDEDETHEVELEAHEDDDAHEHEEHEHDETHEDDEHETHEDDEDEDEDDEDEDDDDDDDSESHDSESHNSHTSSKSDASLERYQRALKDLLARVKVLEADQTTYYTGDADLNTVLTDILSDYDTTKLTYLFTLRGLYGHKKAKEIISKQYGVDFYDSVIKQLED